MEKCNLCPRECGVDRESGELGFCGAPADFKIARAALHNWEEPVISGKNGSGAIFFSGCSLRCVFCQNKRVSSEVLGKTVTDSELEKIIFTLCEEGAHNINFVTPSHYASRLARLLEKIKPKLFVPVIWNSSGYEKKETIRMLDGLVDVYLPDLKYFDPEISKDFSSAPDYFQVAIEAIKEMRSYVGDIAIDENGLIKSGLIVRHLVLPGCRKDSKKVLDGLYTALGSKGYYISIMSQYTPEFALDCNFKTLHRRVTGFEYESVCKRAEELGFDGFFQDRSAASSEYTPNFYGE